MQKIFLMQKENNPIMECCLKIRLQKTALRMFKISFRENFIDRNMLAYIYKINKYNIH